MAALLWFVAGPCAAQTDESQERAALEQRVAELRQAGDPQALMHALEALGDHHFMYSELELALARFEEAHALALVAGSPVDQARARKNIGITQRLMGDFERALVSLEDAAEAGLALDDTPLSLSILGNLGSLYARMGAYQLAEETYRDALGLAQGPELINEYRDILLRLGELYLEAGSDAQALGVLELAYDQLAKLDPAEPLDEAWTRTVLSSAQLANGQPEAAIVNLTAAAAVYREHGMRDAWHFRLLDLGLAWERLDPVQSRAYYQSVLDAASGPGLRWQGHAGLARLARRELDYRTALHHFEATLEAYGASAHLDLSQAERIGLLAGLRRALAGYVDLLLMRGAPTDLRDALRLIDFTTAPDTDWAYAAITEESRQAIATLQRRLSDPALDRVQRQRLHASIERIELAAQRADVLRTRFLELPTFELADIEAALAPDEALLQYHCDDQTLIVILVRSHGTTHHRAPVDCGELSHQSANFRLLLEQDDAGLHHWPARLIYDTLVRPVESRLTDATHLTIIATGALKGLPFSVLHDGTAFLVERHSVAYRNSVSEFLRSTATAAIPSGARRPLLFLGLPEARHDSQAGGLSAIFAEQGLKLDDLPAVREESRVVARHASGDSHILVGRAASEASYQDLSAGRYSVVHFATHGLLSARRAERAALVLANSGTTAEDGFLQAWEIAGQPLDAALVILSGCRTASLPEQTDFGDMGLPSAFLSAGAGAVVGTLWNINDESPIEWMAALYDQLAAGASLRVAVQNAKRAMIRDAQTAHPRHWGSFVLLGDGRQRIALASPAMLPLRTLLGSALVACGGLLLIGAIVVRRR